MCKIYEERFFCINCGSCKKEPQFKSWEEQYLSEKQEWFNKQREEAYRD